MLDWPQTFGMANFQTFGKATCVVIDNLGPISCAQPLLNRSMEQMIPPVPLLRGCFCRLGICGPHPGYDILRVGVRPAHFRLLNLPHILLLFSLLVLSMILFPGFLPTCGDSAWVLSTYMSSPSLGFTAVSFQF